MSYLDVLTYATKSVKYFIRNLLYEELDFDSLEKYIEYFEFRCTEIGIKSEEERLVKIDEYIAKAEDSKKKLIKNIDTLKKATLVRNLDEFIEWLKTEKGENNEKYSIKIRLLIIYYLQKHNIFMMQQVGKTKTLAYNRSTEAIFLHAIFGIGFNEKKEKKNSLLYNPWCDIQNGEHFNKSNLTQLLEIFKKTSLTSIIQDIEQELEKFNKEK